MRAAVPELLPVQPVLTSDHPCRGTRTASCLLVPGAYSQAVDFISAGFIEARDRIAPGLELHILELDPARIPLEAVSVAIDSAIDRILSETRVASLWLGGVSLGAMMAADAARRHGETIAGTCMIGPYPGTRVTQQEILAAGGLARWSAELEMRPSPSDAETRAWLWLAAAAKGRPLYFGYGRNDRFAAGMEMMAQALPGVDLEDGAHDWGTWLVLWERFLARYFDLKVETVA